MQIPGAAGPALADAFPHHALLAGMGWVPDYGREVGILTGR
jgi:hypothetical protein